VVGELREEESLSSNEDAFAGMMNSLMQAGDDPAAAAAAVAKAAGAAAAMSVAAATRLRRMSTAGLKDMGAMGKGVSSRMLRTASRESLAGMADAGRWQGHEQRLRTDEWRKDTRKFLDGVRCTSAVILLVFAALFSAVMVSGAAQKTTVYQVWDGFVFAAFAAETTTRMYCFNDFKAFFSNPFCVIDFVVVMLDVFVMLARELIGNAAVRAPCVKRGLPARATTRAPPRWRTLSPSPPLAVHGRHDDDGSQSMPVTRCACDPPPAARCPLPAAYDALPPETFPVARCLCAPALPCTQPAASAGRPPPRA
jgi:hypothetical protein